MKFLSTAVCGALFVAGAFTMNGPRATAQAGSPAASAADDPLARAEFDQELSIDMKDVDVVNTFRFIAQLISVPFVIDFDSDPSLRLTVKAENMVTRGVLSSLASTYGFDYSSSEEGIIVRRRGLPASTRRTIVGAWPTKLDRPRYDLDFVVRNPSGQLIGSPQMRRFQSGPKAFSKFGFVDAKGKDVLVFDRRRNVLEMRSVGDIELGISISRETAAGLDLVMDLVISKPLSTNSYSEEHLAAQRNVAPGGTTTLTSSNGYEFTLVRWSRSVN